MLLLLLRPAPLQQELPPQKRTRRCWLQEVTDCLPRLTLLPSVFKTQLPPKLLRAMPFRTRRRTSSPHQSSLQSTNLFGKKRQ